MLILVALLRLMASPPLFPTASPPLRPTASPLQRPTASPPLLPTASVKGTKKNHVCYIFNAICVDSRSTQLELAREWIALKRRECDSETFQFMMRSLGGNF